MDVYYIVYMVQWSNYKFSQLCGKARPFLAKVLVSPNNKLIASGGQDRLSDF